MAVNDRSYEHIATRLKELGRYRVLAAQGIIAEGPSKLFPKSYLLALALRESGMRNLNNPANSDKGIMQITEHWHLPWLRQEPGCPAGKYINNVYHGDNSWHPVEGKNAAMDNYCPRATTAMQYVFDYIIMVNLRLARNTYNIPADQQLLFVTVAYNTGAKEAYRGYKEGDPDKYTTGSDYGHWVLRHIRPIDKWLAAHPNWKID